MLYIFIGIAVLSLFNILCIWYIRLCGLYNLVLQQYTFVKVSTNNKVYYGFVLSSDLNLFNNIPYNEHWFIGVYGRLYHQVNSKYIVEVERITNYFKITLHGGVVCRHLKLR